MKYYKTDSRKISLREYYNIASGTSFILPWLLKILGIPLRLTSGIPEPQSFRDNVVDSGTIPSEILVKLNCGVLELRKLGFDQFWFYTLKNSLMGGVAYGVQSLHPSHRTIGKIVFVSMKSRQSFVFVLVSELNDGTILATTNNKPQFNSPPGYTVFRRLQANAEQLWELHENNLAELSRNKPPKAIGDFDQVVALEDKSSQMSFADKVARGIWVEMAEAEVEVLRAGPSRSR